MARNVSKRFRPKSLAVVDLFCGVGGLTHGFIKEGLNVVAGIDNDMSCKFAFEKNNKTRFISKDIAKVTSSEVAELFGSARIRVLVGCAPCQPYSSLNRKKLSKKAARKNWYPLYRFMRIIRKIKPEIVSMENVPDLAILEKYPVFGEFVKCLKEAGYSVECNTVDASLYGVPQKRRRLVLLASRLGPISLLPGNRSKNNLATVRQAISSLPPIRDGETHPDDFLHRSSKLSVKNSKRIASTPRNGGSAKHWRKSLRPKCYTRASGQSYMSTVYGRMRWDDPAPTITTQSNTLGTGRFGHPSQNRAISLREAAVLQTFPRKYEFQVKEKVSMRETARHIGNAVPVKLGRVIAKSIKKHVEEFA